MISRKQTEKSKEEEVSPTILINDEPEDSINKNFNSPMPLKHHSIASNYFNFDETSNDQFSLSCPPPNNGILSGVPAIGITNQPKIEENEP